MTSAKGAHRSNWLAELDQALDRAERSTRELLTFPGDRREAALLLSQILTVRTALDEVRRGHRQEIHPNWLDLLLAADPPATPPAAGLRPRRIRS